MKLRRFFALVIPVVALGIGARVMRMRQPDVWKPNAPTPLLSADGSRLVTISSSTTEESLRVWNVPERREMQVPSSGDKSRHFWKMLAVSPDGRDAALLAVQLSSSKMSFWLEEWDISRDPMRLKWRMPVGDRTVATFASGRLVTFQDSVVKTYDARGKIVSKVKLAGFSPNQVLTSKALSPDGSLIVDGTNLILYDAHSGQVLRQLSKTHPDFNTDSYDFSFAPDHRFLMAEDASGASPVRMLWNVKDGRIEQKDFRVDGFWTAQGHDQVQRDGRVEDVATRRKIATIPLPISGASVTDIQTSVDSQVIVVQRNDGSVWIQNPRWF